MKHSVPHSLGIEVAKQAAENALAAYSERFSDYNPTVTWPTETNAQVSFKIKTLVLSGQFETLPEEISIEMEVPLMLRPFRAKALEVVEREIRQWLDKAAAGSL